MKTGSRSVFIIVAFFLAVTVFAVHLHVKGPMIQPDEGSYLANAAALAGFKNDLGGSYYAGYSILISPAFLIAHTPEGIWMAVKAINALLYFATLLLLWQVAKKMRPEVTGRDRLLVVTVVSLYPMWFVMVGYSFAQMAFVPIFLLAFLFYFYSSQSGGLWAWVALGGTLGFLYWVHPTAAVPLTAAVIGGAYIAWIDRRYIEFLAFILTAGFMVLLYRYGITPWLQSEMNISGLGPHLHYLNLSSLLMPLRTLNGITELIGHIAGQVFYFTIGTVGIIWLGFIGITKKALHKSGISEDNAVHKDRAVAIFLWISFTGIVFISALNIVAVPGSTRLDHWLYGRYAEGVIAPILLVGALSTSFRKLLWSIPVGLLCALLLHLEMGSFLHTARFNASAFWQEFYLRDQGVWIWLVSGGILIVIAAILPRKLSLLMIMAIFAFDNYKQVTWHVAASEAVANDRWGAAIEIRDLYPPGTCVGFDHSGIDSYSKHVYWFDYGFILYDYQMKRIKFNEWLDSCNGPLISYDKDLDEENLVYPVTANQHGGPIVWVKGRPQKDSIYPMFVEDRSPALLRALRSGWYDLEQKHVWSKPEADLRLPVPEGCENNACAAKITLSVYGASRVRPVSVIIQSDYGNADSFSPLIFRNYSRQQVLIPLPGNRKAINLHIRVPDAVSPKALEGTRDERVLGVALHSIELITK